MNISLFRETMDPILKGPITQIEVREIDKNPYPKNFNGGVPFVKLKEEDNIQKMEKAGEDLDLRKSQDVETLKAYYNYYFKKEISHYVGDKLIIGLPEYIKLRGDQLFHLSIDTIRDDLKLIETCIRSKYDQYDKQIPKNLIATFYKKANAILNNEESVQKLHSEAQRIVDDRWTNNGREVLSHNRGEWNTNFSEPVAFKRMSVKEGINDPKKFIYSQPGRHPNEMGNDARNIPNSLCTIPRMSESNVNDLDGLKALNAVKNEDVKPPKIAKIQKFRTNGPSLKRQMLTEM